MKLYGEFAKVEEAEDGTLRVEGYASSEAVDSDGETIKASAMKAAIPDYMTFGAVREMHQPLAAGTALEMGVEDDGRTRFVAHVVDPVAVKKVKAGVYKGFSIGGKVTARDPLAKTTILGIRLTEVSLVDRPANPGATFTMYKADVRSDDVDATTDDAAAASPAADAAPALSATEPPAPATKADTSTDVAKGLGTVPQFAELLQSASWIAQDSAWEAEWEQDGSAVPAKLKAWLADGASLLVTMSAEEADEAVAAVTLPDPVDAVALAETNTGDDALGKAGKRHSKSDQTLVQGMHDQSIALGASCPDCPTCGDATKAARTDAGDELSKAAGARDDALAKVAALTTERDALAKRVETLEAMPAAPKGPLRVVTKGEELAAVAKAETEITETDDVRSALKKVHQAGGVRLR